jgi:hypothetical protein
MWQNSISEGGKYGREMADPIFPTACDFHGKCRDLLHAANLCHGTDGFTSPPKEGMLRIFSPEKSDGFSRVWTREPLEGKKSSCFTKPCLVVTYWFMNYITLGEQKKKHRKTYIIQIYNKIELKVLYELQISETWSLSCDLLTITENS